MLDDLTLPFDEDREPAPIGRIQAAFEEFHRKNPHVYRILEELAAEWLARHQAVGVKMLWEVLRWRLGVRTDVDETEYRLSNNYTSRYARLLLANHPEWRERIHVRQLRAA